MDSFRLYSFYQHYFSTCKAKWCGWLSVQQRMDLLQQATQWKIETLSEEEYRRWL
ncbi:glucose uptake inhibitor SgrT [Pectobacteriaceae bacterium CE70]|uniref:Glucose uptake inhibitor SgrT n=1 Tax=Serratia sp. (strain ATCC 39006) TaxID=104623 RepID=A0A2I5T4E8_SERS3|nr:MULTISPECIES: glucose uptake inhibitor SgrT [Enterobacterales]WJV57681.1 glucose uptake inhibitor SgrT [Pectobacteriaceae bacterium C111]WJV61993.1 glucose uptake inhibitor SgrT [Pectobacteriaceae bacterium C52]WJV66266.1 glucose uptake inhibitor SgrT [Pectobacteriaceae bacterium CE70]WJY10273.1 glucose uptake inhibitor SgrT [Pectobacteriaceae bacterium C80]WJY15672.1 glucose uptake inhibitor SgrT [Pectobacteriaceae bacterium CE90]